MLQVLLLCTAAASWISIVYKIDHRTSQSDFDVLYSKPWIRISPYLVGLAGGVAAWALRTRWRIPAGLRTRLLAGLGWLLATGLALSLVYGVFQADLTLTKPLGKLNTSLSRPAWAVALCWVSLACLAGYGGPVQWVLSLPPLRQAELQSDHI